MKTPHGVRFAHFRNVWYPHGAFEVLAQGGMTAAYVQDVDQDGGPIVYVALAYCHEKDNYSKAQGRIKACGQLLRLTAAGGHLDDETYVGGPRFFYEAGLAEDVIPALFAQLASETGFVQVHKEKARERDLNKYAKAVI